MALSDSLRPSFPQNPGCTRLAPRGNEERRIVKTICRIATCLALLATIATNAKSISPIEDDYRFNIERRVNAHGDEFMALALTKDARRLIVGTESGKLIIWGIAERRVLKQLDQGSAVHSVVALNDPDEFVAAGGPHNDQASRPVVRKWRISTGESYEWNGVIDGTVMTLAIDPKGELVAAGSALGHFAVWNSSSGQLVTRRSFDGVVAGIALNAQEIYLTKIQTEEEEPKNSILRLALLEKSRPSVQLTKEEERKVWAEVKLSPDGRFMAARFADESKYGVALFDLTNHKQISSFDAQNFAWSANGNLVLFDSDIPIARVSIDARGQVTQSQLSEGVKWHGSGTPSHMSDRAVSPDGMIAWAVFQLGAALVELNLNEKTGNTLYRLDGLLYAMDVREPLGLIATGGDDHFVRVRKLSDLSLVKEFKAEPGVPQGVALLEDGRHVVFSSSSKDSPTRISIGELESGQSRKLIDIDEPFIQVHAARGGFVYSRGGRLVLAGNNGATIREYSVEGKLGAYAMSKNGEWLVAANQDGKLFRFEIKTGSRTSVGQENVESLTALSITNDGVHVYTAEFGADLKRWDVTAKTVKVLASIRGQAKTLKLSLDEKEITVGGNHRDVAVYEISTGERRLYLQIAASDFYVTNVWLGGDRLLFSTDAGVLIDGFVRR
jgi:WD40 repeat protein